MKRRKSLLSLLLIVTIKIRIFKLGMVVHAYSPSSEKVRYEDPKFRAILGYKNEFLANLR